MLSPQARRLLDLLVQALPNVVPGDPRTYLGYKRVHDRLGLEMIGHKFGESLKRQGLEELALWTSRNGHPAITGLVIDTESLQPGEGYFRVHGITLDFSWWESEIRRARGFDWERVLVYTKDWEAAPPAATQGHPDVAAYTEALREVIATAPLKHVAMLRAHRDAADQTISASGLARAAGYESFHAANLQYGILAGRVCDLLGFVPPIGNSGQPSPTHVLASPYREGPRAEWVWIMRPRVAAALDVVFGEMPNDAAHPIHSDEPLSTEEYVEGSVLQVLVNQYERNHEARKACLEYWGPTCGVCEMDFQEVYGLDANRGIHVHHLVPLSQIRSEYQVNPVEDLRPVCPNCHAALHSQHPPLSLDALRRIYRARRKPPSGA